MALPVVRSILPRSWIPLTLVAASAVGAPPARAGTFLNPSDCSPTVILSPDHLGVSYTDAGSNHGVRSDRAILP